MQRIKRKALELLRLCGTLATTQRKHKEQHKMTNYQAMVQRINQANTVEALAKVELSLDRIFNSGIFTVNQYSKLDSKIVDKQIAIEVNRITQTQHKGNHKMTKTDYNGWTNRETWVINLWMGDYFQEIANDGEHLLADYIEETIWDMLDDANVPGMFKGYDRSWCGQLAGTGRPLRHRYGGSIA